MSKKLFLNWPAVPVYWKVESVFIWPIKVQYGSFQTGIHGLSILIRFIHENIQLVYTVG